MALSLPVRRSRSAAPLAAATRLARRSWIVFGSFFRSLPERFAAMRAAVGSSAPVGDGQSAVERGSFTCSELPGDVVALRLLDSEPDTLDAWYTESARQMSEWTPERRLRYLHDVRRADALKAHSIDRVLRVLKAVGRNDARDGRGAVLLGNRTVAATLDGVVSRYVTNHWRIRCFADEAEAIRWLSETP